MADDIDDRFEDFLEFFLHKESWDWFEGFQLEHLRLVWQKSGDQLEISSDETENTKWILTQPLVKFFETGLFIFYRPQTKQQSKKCIST